MNSRHISLQGLHTHPTRCWGRCAPTYPCLCGQNTSLLTILQTPCIPSVDNLGSFYLHRHVWTVSSSMMDPPKLEHVPLFDNVNQSVDCGASKSSYIGRLLPLWPPLQFGPLPPLWLESSDMVVSTYFIPSKHITNNQGQSPPLPQTNWMAKLPYYSSLQSTLGVLGQRVDLKERLANNKYGERLIYTPAPVAACIPLAAACTHSYSNMHPFKPALDVTPVCAQTHVLITMAEPNSPSAQAWTLCLHPQPCACKESAPDSMRPRLESMPRPTCPCLKFILVPIRLRPFPCVRPQAFVRAPAATQRIHARSHASAPGVYAQSHLSMPFTMHSCPTRSHS